MKTIEDLGRSLNGEWPEAAPGWKDEPKWALAQGLNGKWHWFEVVPEAETFVFVAPKR